MLAQYPGIRSFIITQKRLFPIKITWLLCAPSRMIIIAHRFGKLPNDFTNIFYLIRGIVLPLMPGPIKLRNGLIRSLRPGLSPFDCTASECIGDRPLVAIDSILLLRHTQGG